MKHVIERFLLMETKDVLATFGALPGAQVHKDFVYIPGSLPERILLVGHADTVFSGPPRSIEWLGNLAKASYDYPSTAKSNVSGTKSAPATPPKPTPAPAVPKAEVTLDVDLLEKNLITGIESAKDETVLNLLSKVIDDYQEQKKISDKLTLLLRMKLADARLRLFTTEQAEAVHGKGSDKVAEEWSKFNRPEKTFCADPNCGHSDSNHYDFYDMCCVDGCDCREFAFVMEDSSTVKPAESNGSTASDKPDPATLVPAAPDVPSKKGLKKLKKIARKTGAFLGNDAEGNLIVTYKGTDYKYSDYRAKFMPRSVEPGKRPSMAITKYDRYGSSVSGTPSYSGDYSYNRQGLGADDRVGIAMIWLMRNSGHSILITDGEESGGIGANAAARAIPEKLADHQFAIEIDRNFDQEMVFYSVSTPEFEDYMTEQTGGFKTNWGSYTDIADVCSAVGICGVNLAAGYWNQHTSSEMFNYDAWLRTYNVVRAMLYERTHPRFPLPRPKAKSAMRVIRGGRSFPLWDDEELEDYLATQGQTDDDIAYEGWLSGSSRESSKDVLDEVAVGKAYAERFSVRAERDPDMPTFESAASISGYEATQLSVFEPGTNLRNYHETSL